jgi:DNA-binding CsgD family transcriptional regulator
MQTPDFGADAPTDVRSGATTVAAALFALIALLIGWDVVADYRAGTEVGHLIIEGTVMTLAVAGVVALWHEMTSAWRDAGQLRVDLESARREAERFRRDAREALRGLGAAIDDQFTRWGLTPAEREVGLLLLKGLSHKEIAGTRATTETTIRQQALAVYRKAGLRNRAELSAFFLEDLLLPAGQR